MDLHFIGTTTTKKSIAIRLGNHTLFTENMALSVRVGQEKVQLVYGSGSNYDVRISIHDLSKDTAIELNKRLKTARVYYVSHRKTIIVVPDSVGYISASFPNADAVTVEYVDLPVRERLGDLDLVNGDFATINGQEQIYQDIISRLISSRNPMTSFRSGSEYCSGWEEYVGKPRTKENLALIETEMLSALTRDGQYPVTKVRAFPVGENGIQPIVYYGTRVLNLPIQIDLSEGGIIPI